MARVEIRGQYIVHLWPRDTYHIRTQYNDARAVFKNWLKENKDECALWHCASDGALTRIQASVNYNFQKLHMPTELV